MPDFPSHFLPNWTDDARADALFHYTTASGLAGIFGARSLWSTAYYCANDEQELSAGKGVLTHLFREELFNLEQTKDPRIDTFLRRGVDPTEYANHFEGLLTSLTLSALCAYITCFCRPSSKEDFHHGLLSQWRGYGQDGGYAIQFSRGRLLAAISASDKPYYELRDVHYDVENDLKGQLLSHKAAFVGAFHEHLDQLAGPISTAQSSWTNPISKLLGGPLESLLDYLVFTKNQHFAEERESRMCTIQSSVVDASTKFPVNYFNRSGLLVPYIATPKAELDIVKCIDWVIVGPGPRIDARFKSVSQLVRNANENIQVRVSHIPFTRL